MIHSFKNIFQPSKSFILPLIFFLILNVHGLRAFAQPDIFQDLNKTKVENKPAALSEKIFVHSDKSFYMAGELLWFKIYAVDGKFNQLMLPERFTYIEVLDRSNTAVLQAKISMNDGTGNGSFFIPLSINTGNYTLRAYSNWMKNFNPGYYFEKTISIFNPLKVVPLKNKPESHNYSVGFFPEGGDLINGIKSKVGVKVSDQYGKGIEFSGCIINQDKDTVAHFGNLRYGMGSFYFTPEKTTSYHAIVVLADTTLQIAIPAIYPEGFVMHVTDTANGQVKIVVHANTSFTLPIYLFAQTRKIVNYSEAGTLIGGEAVFLVDKHKLGDGFSTLTIFDSGKQPVCERLYFKRPAALKINLKPDPAICGIRQKVNLHFDIGSQNGKTIATSLSAAVYLVDALQPVEEINILNYLWLSSDIRGVIESPDSYFRDSTELTVDALENLILTQGWRKFSSEYHGKKEDLYYTFAPEFEGQVIRGRITDKTSGLGIANISAFLSVPGKKFQLAHSRSNENGDLVFVIPSVFGETEMIAQIADKADSNNRIEIFSPFSNSFSPNRVPAFIFSPHLRELYESRSIASQVQNIYFGDSLQRVYINLLKDSTAFYGRPDKTYYLDAYTRFNSMEEVFREYVQDVILRRSQEKFHFRVLNTPRNVYFDGEPLVLVDGVPVSNIDSIIAFDPLKFYKIEIVAAKYILGADQVNGIVSLNTYAGDMAAFPLDPQAVVMDESEGSGQRRQFYSPQYDEHTIPNHLPDFRNLLYWSPDLQTDQQGDGYFSFYTSDQKGKFAVVVQGITDDGEAGFGIGFFEVRDDH
jgi:hypothetical protein